MVLDIVIGGFALEVLVQGIKALLANVQKVFPFELPANFYAYLNAALAVVGHCWPVFSGFKGGMGLTPAGGGMLAINIPLSIMGIGVLIALTLLIKHSARAAFATAIVLSPLFYLAGGRGMIVYVAAASGLVLAIRFLSDWNRQYRELWLDREKAEE